MGNDNYSNDRERERARSQGLSVLGIGKLNAPFIPLTPPSNDAHRLCTSAEQCMCCDW